MNSQELARVLDPQQVAASVGPIAKMSVEVPASWAGCVVQITIPRLLSCGACDGGGCDRCGRSGAVRRSEDGGPIDLTLPPSVEQGVRVRLVRPFDSDELEILLVDIVPSETPSPDCQRVPGAERSPAASSHRLILALALVALLLFVLAVTLTRL